MTTGEVAIDSSPPIVTSDVAPDFSLPTVASGEAFTAPIVVSAGTTEEGQSSSKKRRQSVLTNSHTPVLKTPVKSLSIAYGTEEKDAATEEKKKPKKRRRKLGTYNIGPRVGVYSGTSKKVRFTLIAMPMSGMKFNLVVLFLVAIGTGKENGGEAPYIAHQLLWTEGWVLKGNQRRPRCSWQQQEGAICQEWGFGAHDTVLTRLGMAVLYIL